MEDQEEQEQYCILQYLSSLMLSSCEETMLGTDTISQTSYAVFPLGNLNTSTGLTM